MDKLYWQSLDHYKDLKEQSNPDKAKTEPEFSIEGLDESEIKGQSSRRDFLKLLGFSVSAVALVSSCQMPVRKAIPLLNRPDDLIPGVPNFYASTFYDGNDYCSILVKTRENRPIKIEGNNLSEITKGATNARTQASVLNLYDDARLKKPRVGKVDSDWETIDRDMLMKLENAKESGRKVALITPTIISPSTRQLINEFISEFPNVQWIQRDTISFSAMRKANEMNFGQAVIPNYHFDKADTIVSFNADFLGNWLLPVAFTKQFSTKRILTDTDPVLNRLYQFESHMSLTGANADYRIAIRPSEESAVLLKLYNEIARSIGASTYVAPAIDIDVSKAATDLLASKGKSIVVSGTNDLNIQLIVNAINHLLGNYNSTIDITKPIHLNQANEKEMSKLVSEMNTGLINGLLVYNTNPVYDYPDSHGFVSGLEKVAFKAAFSETLDETAEMCEYVCATNNYLESWDDAEPIKGSYSYTQPTIQPIFNTRQFQDCLLKWMKLEMDYATYMEQHWKSVLSQHSENLGDFTNIWNQLKHDGVFQHDAAANQTTSFTSVELTADEPSNNGLELALYKKMSIGTGKYANNPWLLEMPDPITTATWDNYVCVPVDFAEANGLKYEDVVTVNGEFELPVIVQPGQASGTVSIALGYGRTAAGKAGNGVGKNVYHLINNSNGYLRNSGAKVDIKKVEGKTYELAATQIHHSMEDRPIVRETTLGKFKENPISGNEQHIIDEKNNVTLYSKIDYDGIHWGMTIDLTSCTGCANCVIACQAENNVPVIGKDQIRKRRIMHWLRIDRYYSADPESPEVHHMPVMCQHCDNAPCENVCPVAATNHSDEGLNQMAYNRCIGTRYCVNNCPYKVRRFNWYEYVNNNKFDYNMNSELGKLVLNPDVIVRQRGVVEKCSLCAQRLQEKKLVAKKENRVLVDGEVQTACSQSCPTNAIHFGNLKDEDSVIVQDNKSDRMYHLLEQLHTLPSTSYLTKVRNKES